MDAVPPNEECDGGSEEATTNNVEAKEHLCAPRARKGLTERKEFLILRGKSSVSH